MFVSRMTELQSLRQTLQERKSYNDTLQEQLRSGKEVQLMIQELLDRIELQIQRQFEEVSAMYKRIFNKNIQFDLGTASNTTSSGGTSELEPREPRDEICEATQTEDSEISLSDDEQELQFDEPASDPPKDQPELRQCSTPLKQLRVRLNRNIDAGGLNVREPKIELLDDEVAFDAGRHQKLKKVPPRPKPKRILQGGNSFESGRRSLGWNKQVEQVTVEARTQILSKNPGSGIVIANDSTPLSDYDDQSHVQAVESELPLNEEVALGAGQHQKVEKAPPRPRRTRTLIQEESVSKSGGRSSRGNEQVHSNGGTGYTRIMKNPISFRKDASKFRKTYSCEECGKRYNHKGNFTKHLRIHTGEKPYKCEVCTVTFNRKYSLSEHLRIHTGEKPYECKVCNKSFTQSGSLASHSRIHSGEKPFKCEVCNKSFTRSSDLASHIRIHTDEKPYECKVCNATFNVKSNLSKHLMIHTGEKPFECDICRETFRRKDTLSDHMNRHSGRKPYKCKKCKKAFGNQGNFSKHLKFHQAEE